MQVFILQYHSLTGIFDAVLHVAQLGFFLQSKVQNLRIRFNKTESKSKLTYKVEEINVRQNCPPVQLFSRTKVISKRDSPVVFSAKARRRPKDLHLKSNNTQSNWNPHFTSIALSDRNFQQGRKNIIRLFSNNWLAGFSEQCFSQRTNEEFEIILTRIYQF